jgi:hypothetical protein
MRDVVMFDLTLTISASRSSGFKKLAEGGKAWFYLILTIQGYLAVFV